METILDKIIAGKKKSLQQTAYTAGVSGPRKKEKKSFISILEKADKVSLIAEFKRASPSKGDINTFKDPVKQTKAYEEAGADAVSVLTDNLFFKGSYSDLERVREAVNIPVLCKDFIIDRVQIDVAEQAGADIVLLIAAALNDEKLMDLYEYALEKGMEVLLEVHNEEEAERALRTGNRLIGVNNRNLKTFEVDLSITEKLAPTIKKEGRFLISESGIKTGADVQRVAAAGADGILVGETLMRHNYVGKAIKALKIPFPKEPVV